jgi:hypothetical protein
MKATAIVIALAMAASSPIAFAGVAPNSAASAAAQSGAKVAAPAKNSSQDDKSGGEADTKK